ncbi:MAG: hypothetical protein R3F37_20905 [Candidatus Competibacteraceae bacterium]
MVLTYMFALMGIQSAPALSMWAFTNKTPAGFPYQQVWASPFGIGLILFLFTAFQGSADISGADVKFLQAHPEIVTTCWARVWAIWTSWRRRAKPTCWYPS